MRVISVVTLVSPDGAYGGPTRVAVNQAAALRGRGHQVIVAAATRGYDDAPSEMDGVPLRLFPARTAIPRTGFAGLTAPGLLHWLNRFAGEADIVHIHAARDLVTLPAATIARHRGIPYVLQTHGMIDHSSKVSARILDFGVTRPVLRGAKSVLYLTPRERADLLTVNRGNLPLAMVLNGVPVSNAPPGPPPGTREVLFLARLQSRKRPDIFVRMAQRLRSAFPDVRFSLVGPDEGMGPEVERLIGSDSALSWEGAIPPESTLERMSQASVYVLPSINEPFPMSVLEAMSLGRPVVVTDSCGLAPIVSSTGSGMVVDSSLESLVTAVGSMLESPDKARRMGETALATSRDRLSMDSVAKRLEEIYRES